MKWEDLKPGDRFPDFTQPRKEPIPHAHVQVDRVERAQ